MQPEDQRRKTVALTGVLGAGLLGFGALALMLKASGPTVIRPPRAGARPAAQSPAPSSGAGRVEASTAPAAALPPLDAPPPPGAEIRRVEGEPIILDAVPSNAAPGGVYEDPRRQGSDRP